MDISRRMFAGSAAFIMILGAMLVMVPQASQAAVNPVPVLSIKLDSAQATAAVTESKQGIVTFSGTAQIDKLPVERCVVTLQSAVDAGWATQVTPSTLVYTSLSPQTFSVTVVVPIATLNTVTGNLAIDGRAVAGGLQSTANTKAIITVDAYYKVMLESDAPYREISPGTQAYFSFKIWNMGNSLDSYDIEILNLKDLVNERWTVTLSATTISKVNPGDNKIVKITAQSPRDWTIWVSKPSLISVKVTSQNAREGGGVVSQTFPMYAYQKGFYIPGFDPLFLIAAFAIGLVFLRRKRQ